ncbi:MAG TPA: ROK family protein [Clostridia bacterium]|nr:ROK family protein [Clostridia bacterium]
MLYKQYWIGVDLGGTNIRTGLVNEEGIILREQKEETEAYKGSDYVIEKLMSMIEKTGSGYEIQAIGIGMPGPLNPYKGIIMNPINLPGWNNIFLADILKKHFDVPCYIDNDCNVAALAEALEGAGKDYPIVFYITVSTGIGGGLCINRQIISGATGNAGEIANIVISRDTVKHSFLNPGSLEGMASGISILRMAAEHGIKAEKAHEVFLMAEAGNAAAIKIADIVVDSLARGMATIAHVVDPHIFVLGGGVSLAVPGFTGMIKERFEQYIYEVMRNQIEIKPAQLSDPGIIGAVYMARKRIEREIYE